MNLLAIGAGIATARQPEAADKIRNVLIIGAALAEATAIYGFVMAFIMLIFLK